MTCKQCVHHEAFHDDVFYCEAQNDLMEESETSAEDCQWFVPLHVEGDEQESSCTAEVRSTAFADEGRSDA